MPLLQYFPPLHSVAIPLPLGGALPLLPTKKGEEGGRERGKRRREEEEGPRAGAGVGARRRSSRVTTISDSLVG